MTTYTITFNEGTADEVILTESSENVAYFRIHAGEQDIIKNAEIEFNDTGTDWEKITVGDSVTIQINSTTVFAGTVNRKRRKYVGARKIFVQATGNTIKLWKYKTDRNKVYENQYTSDIVKDLVSTYCTGITTSNTPTGEGALIVRIVFDSFAVGDAIKELTKFDNYLFYVDEDDDLHYFQPSSTPQFTISERDIKDMSWVEENLSNLVNDGIVFGMKEYGSEEIVEDGDEIFILNDTNKRIADRFRAQSDYLSGIKAYVDRSTGGNTPGYLRAEIRTDSTSIFPENLVSDTPCWDIGKMPSPPGWLPYFEWDKDEGELAVTENDYYWSIYRGDDLSSSKWWKMYMRNPPTDGSDNNDVIDTYTNDLSTDPNLSYDEWWPAHGTITYNATEDRIDFNVTVRGMSSSPRNFIDFETPWYHTDELAFQFDIYFSEYEDNPDDFEEIQPHHGFYVALGYDRYPMGYEFSYIGIQFDIDDRTGLIPRAKAILNDHYNDIMASTDWYDISTGTTYTFKTRIVNNQLEFHVDGNLIDTASVPSGYGPGYIKKYRHIYHILHPGIIPDGEEPVCVTLTGWTDNFQVDYYYNDEHVLTSTDAGSTWIRVNRRLRAGYGWDKDYITATASDATSQANYGIQFRRFPVDGYYKFIKTTSDAQSFIDRIVSSFKDPLDRATLRIDGNENITLKQKFTLDIPLLNINSELWKISSYTHEITPSGFYTTINAGEMPFDLMQEIRKIQVEARK